MFWKHKTDTEFVESQRKWLLRSRWIGVIMALVAICLTAITLTLFDGFIEILLGKDKAGIEFAKGILMGMIIMKMFFVIGGFIGLTVMWFIKPRALRLLVDYHDRLKKAGMLNQEKGSRAAS